MISNWLQHMGTTKKAHLYLLFGILLLLNILNLNILNLLLISIAILLILDGLVEAGYWQWIKNKLHAYRKEHK